MAEKILKFFRISLRKEVEEFNNKNEKMSTKQIWKTLTVKIIKH